MKDAAYLRDIQFDVNPIDRIRNPNNQSNKPPVANAGADITATVNLSITIRGSGTDSDGTIVSYIWKKGSMVLATTASFSYMPTVVGTDILTLTVTDDDGTISSDTLKITVLELDEEDIIAPQFTSSNSISVNENQTSAITLNATDTNSITFSISGTDAGSFNINSSSGVITFKTAPDYEIKSSYSFMAVATDAKGNRATQNIIITIIDIYEETIDNTPPVFTSSISVSVNENQTGAITLSATDTNSITFSISGTDADRFNINSSTGVMTFKTAPDFETKNSYSFTAMATDSKGNSVSQTVSITIIESVNKIPIANAGDNQTVYEGDMAAFDASSSSDSDGGIISYEWKEDSSVLSTNISFDKNDFTVGTHTIVLTVTDDDGAIASDTVIISVNSNSPITHNSIIYGTVISPYTGRVWLDRNLGASGVCTAYNDSSCYGDYYQWGRNTDGHEISSSDVISIQSDYIDNVGHNDFIKSSSGYNQDWAKNADNSGSLRQIQWRKIDGSSVCPIGFKVPTETELSAETTGLSSPNTVNDSGSAFSSFLKLPSAGYRHYSSGSSYRQGSHIYIWSVSLEGSRGRSLYFSSSYANWSSSFRAGGSSVRCIKD